MLLLKVAQATWGRGGGTLSTMTGESGTAVRPHFTVEETGSKT